LPDFDVSAWTGLFAPAGTPRPIVDRLNAETQKLTSDKDYVALVQKMGTDVATSTPEEFGAFVRDDVARWTQVIDHAGIPKVE
jgi:tripartite-type tricarboxylate transporter receptor subunit TctC